MWSEEAPQELLGFPLASLPPGLLEDASAGNSLGIAPPPGLAVPSQSQTLAGVLEQQQAQFRALLLTTPSPLPAPRGHLSPREPQHVALPGSWATSPPFPRCESPLRALGLSVAEDVRSPEQRPLQPQPRRAFVPPSAEQPLCLPSSPSPGLEHHDLQSPEKKEYYQFAFDASSRPLSSISTSAGPTPSPEDFMRHPTPQMLMHSPFPGSPVLGVDDAWTNGLQWVSDSLEASAAAASGRLSPALFHQQLQHQLQQQQQQLQQQQQQLQQQQQQLQVQQQHQHQQQAQQQQQTRGAGYSGSAAAASAAALQSGPEGCRGQDAPLTADVVVQLSKTQAGSKLLQRKLLKGHPNVIKDILEGLETELPEIMCNMYGNYLCSAAFQSCSVGQRLRMLEITSRHLRAVATDKWGTHALQSLLSLVCTTEEQNLLLPPLQEHAVELSCDQHSTHVVQRALISFGSPCPDLLFDKLLRNLCEVAHNPHGLCVLKRLILQTKSGPNQQRLLLEMTKHALDLVQSPFGNYVIQYAFEEWGADLCRPIVQALMGHVLHLSIQKFSSNVVEQMIRVVPEVQWRLAQDLSDKEHAQLLMSTVYGMHVARHLLKVVSTEQRAVLESVFAGCLRGSRNQRLRERWEGLLLNETLPPAPGTCPEEEQAQASGRGRQMPDGSAQQSRRRRVGGVRGSQPKGEKQGASWRLSSDGGGAGRGQNPGVFTPGLLVSESSPAT